MATETPSPLSAPSWMTLSPSTPSIRWRTSLLQKSTGIFKECTPAKQTELPVEPHLCRPFSGEAWHGPVPQEKDGPPLLRWSQTHNTCMRAPTVFLQCNQPSTLSTLPAQLHLCISSLDLVIGLFLLATGPHAHVHLLPASLLARGAEGFHASCFLPEKGALLR